MLHPIDYRVHNLIVKPFRIVEVLMGRSEKKFKLKMRSTRILEFETTSMRVMMSWTTSWTGY